MERTRSNTGFQPPRIRNTFMATTPLPPEAQKFYDKYDDSLERYKEMAKCAENLLREALREEDMQDWMLTSRVKELDSLKEKLQVRYGDQKDVQLETIQKEIVDLVGLRVILYMPTKEEQNRAINAVQSVWGEHVKPHNPPKPKEPEEEEDHQAQRRKEAYKPRHLGYRAIHLRAEMLPSHHSQYRHKPHDMVEVQVVSALTHVWAQVGHDILYKSYAFGEPTYQEERTMDALNGLIQSGELLLAEFNEMVHKRTYARWKHRYELENWLKEADILQGLEEPPQFESEGLEVLLGFLTEQGKNYPIAVREELKQLGFPGNPRLELIIGGFLPEIVPAPGMTAVICLIRQMLSSAQRTPFAPPDSDEDTTAGAAESPAPGPAAVVNGLREATDVPGLDLPSGQQCRIMMSALCFLQRVFGPSEAYEYLRDLDMTPEEKKSLDFVLESPKRQMFLRENSDQTTDKSSLEHAWRWFQKQRRLEKSICGLAFRLAETGPMKDVSAYRLLEKLTIGHFGELSRASTFSNDNEPEVSGR